MARLFFAIPETHLTQVLSLIEINEIEMYLSQLCFLHIGTSLLSLSSCGSVFVCVHVAC